MLGIGRLSMTEIVTCARCHCKFERTCIEDENGVVIEHTLRAVAEHEPICEECEHEFLAWTGCIPIV
jgi:hypothetical protein